MSLVDAASGAAEALLPHRCPGAAVDTPVAYPIGPRVRDRLADGETTPATARCPHCGARLFASLVDPTARAAHRANARPDPTALRPPARPTGIAGRRQPIPIRPGLASTPVVRADPCPACGAVPDSFGLCRCSA